MQQVAPNNLYDVWDWVREGLLKVQEKALDGWIPEDVYMAIKTGHSALYVMPEDRGFVVLTPKQDFRGVKLHVWCAYHKGKNAFETYMPFIMDVAREMGAIAVTGDSTRKGWGKFMEPKMTTYEVKV